MNIWMITTVFALISLVSMPLSTTRAQDMAENAAMGDETNDDLAELEALLKEIEQQQAQEEMQEEENASVASDEEEAVGQEEVLVAPEVNDQENMQS